MDVIGFVLATTFLATVFAVFGMIGRIIDGVADGMRYTVAPTMIGGFRAWEERRAASPATAAPTDAVDRSAGTGADGQPPGDRAPGLVVPVQSLPTRGWLHFGHLMHRRVTAAHRAR